MCRSTLFFDRILIVTIPATSASRQLFGTIDQSSTKKKKTKRYSAWMYWCKEGKEVYITVNDPLHASYTTHPSSTLLFFPVDFFLCDILAKPIGGFLFLFWLAIKCNCADIYCLFRRVQVLIRIIECLLHNLVCSLVGYHLHFCSFELKTWISYFYTNVLTYHFYSFWVCYLFGGKEYKYIWQRR